MRVILSWSVVALINGHHTRLTPLAATVVTTNAASETCRHSLPHAFLLHLLTTPCGRDRSRQVSRASGDMRTHRIRAEAQQVSIGIAHDHADARRLAHLPTAQGRAAYVRSMGGGRAW